MHCPHCQREVPPDSQFCNICGARVNFCAVYIFPFVRALLGLTFMTPVAYPLVTRGKPILSLTVVSYEGTMLGAILFTVLGIIFESGLPKPKTGLYDTPPCGFSLGSALDSQKAVVWVESGVVFQSGLPPLVSWPPSKMFSAVMGPEASRRGIIRL